MANWSMITRLAWRDTRKNRGRLMLFMSSIILGIAALVAINSFNYNLQSDIDSQSASLLGADLVVSGNKPAPASIAAAIDSLEAERAQKLELFSMAYFPKTDHSQFVRLQALEGDFPFYGQLKTTPEGIRSELEASNGVLLDKNFMDQQGVQIGDSVRLGTVKFKIIGELLSDFASAGIASGFAPPMYISKKALDQTDLVQPGSLVNYTYYFKLPASFEADVWADQHEEGFRAESMRLQTIEGQKESLSEAFSNLNAFLNLVALISLLLGCIGVASSILIYVKTKIPSIAIFRCLGMKGKEVFYVYLLQIMSLGGIGVAIGAALGTVVQLVLPQLFKGFLPLEVTTQISWLAISEGLVIGIVVTLLFALLPLLAVRKISPLRILRSSFEADVQKRDPVIYLVYVVLAASIFGFLWYLTKDATTALMYCVSLAAAFALLFGVAKLIVWGVKRFFPRSWSFVFRQGLANLFRPNNQTATLLVSIGLGTAILTLLFVIQGMLLQNVNQMDAGNQPNVILYGIEKDQLEALTSMTAALDMPIIEQVPIVTMRMTGWQGKSKAEWIADSTRTAKSWAYNREIRVTFKDSLGESDELIAGEFPKHRSTHGDSIFISLDDGFAENMGVEIGDDISFNVQGMLIKTYVGSLRKIDFANMRTRFFVLFPTDVLEDAPQFHVLVTKSPNPATTAKYRTEVVKSFPNISVIDLSSILLALGDILKKVSYIIQFMAGFSMLTGLIVLLSSLLLSKLQRIKETVLLRTLGARKKQLLHISAVEYGFLGVLAATTGIGIALAGSWFLAKYELELDFYVPWNAIIVIFFLVVSIITLVGLFNSREVLRKSPLEVLRREV